MKHQADPLAHAHQSARAWLSTIGQHLGTEDRNFTFRVVKAWLQLVRDRLTVDNAVHLAAQLPELLRGVYYEGWVPSRVPLRYGAEEFARSFAHAANISSSDVPRVARAVSEGLNTLFSPGQLDHVLTLMPTGLRAELHGEVPAAASAPAGTPTPPDSSAPAASSALAASGAEQHRLNTLEDTVVGLAEAVSTLARALEELPTTEPSGDRMAKAAQAVHRILTAQDTPRG